MREIIAFKSTPAPRFRYSQCVKTGPFYEFAGMIALTLEGRLAEGGVEAETRQILKNLSSAINEIGLSLSDMVSAQIFTTVFDEFPKINKVWEEFFTDDFAPPARTSIGVAALPLNCKIEMSFRFYKN